MSNYDMDKLLPPNTSSDIRTKLHIDYTPPHPLG